MCRSWIMSSFHSNARNAMFMDTLLEAVHPMLSQRKEMKRVGTKLSVQRPIIKVKNREAPMVKALFRPMLSTPHPKRHKKISLIL